MIPTFRYWVNVRRNLLPYIWYRRSTPCRPGSRDDASVLRLWHHLKRRIIITSSGAIFWGVPGRRRRRARLGCLPAVGKLV
ncbi:MAG: hypothetical protein U0703_11990 [Anaerolineae bacterium]